LSSNVVSFRFPVESLLEGQPEGVVRAHRITTNNIVALSQQLAALSSKVSALGTPSTTAAAPAVPTSVTENISTETIITPGTVTGGKVNNQTGVASYAVQQSDNASLIILDDASPIAVSLPAVTIPFYATLSNQGTGTATITPASGTINGAASAALPGGSWVVLYYDGSNWWADSPGSSVGGVTQLLAGSGIALSPVSGIGAVTVSGSGTGLYSLGGALSSGNVSLGADAGTGGGITVSGVDGNHQITVSIGVSPSSGSGLFTVTFTASRGHTCSPVKTPAYGFGAYPDTTFVSSAPSATAYTVTAYAALSQGKTYKWNVSCP
jgi:hypothetical protein